MSISEFNDFSMSNWSKIQWVFHDFFIFTNFKNISWNSMIFPWSWNRSEFQWFFKSCGNPVNPSGWKSALGFRAAPVLQSWDSTGQKKKKLLDFTMARKCLKFMPDSHNESTHQILSQSYEWLVWKSAEMSKFDSEMDNAILLTHWGWDKMVAIF